MATCIIFAARTGVVRRIITDTPTSSFALHVGEGEDLVQWFGSDMTEYPDLAAATAYVAEKCGFAEIPSARCVALDDNLTVAAVVRADPLLDMHEGMLLVQDDDALVDQHLQSDGTFQ